MTGQAAKPFYVTGGTLHDDAPSYVQRAADGQLYAGLRRGAFCYVLTSRQMGKSSLMVRTAQRLRRTGASVVVLDLTAIGQNLSAEQWYEGLLSLMGQQLQLEDELEDFWFAHARLGPLQRWRRALHEIVLPAAPYSLVVFIDEIDAVRSLPFSTDEFFAGIREFYNQRAQDPALQRLTFCLLGVASPSDLIRDTRTTPFNIGERIELHDFTEAEAAPLALGLGRSSQTGKLLLRRILHWTGGHPYLTQQLCQTLAANNQAATNNDVDRCCTELFLSARARERDDNLLFVRERLLHSEGDLTGLLELYARIRGGKRVRDEEQNPLVNVLRLAGIARVADERLVVRNRIYEHVFDATWIQANLPAADVRRQQAAYRRGLWRAAAWSAVIILLMAGFIQFALRGWRQAEQQERMNRRLLYAAQMNLAQQAWESGNLHRVAELLEQQQPQPGQPDLRGFEWHYLQRLCHDDRRTDEHTSEVWSVAFSPDGRQFVAGGADGQVRLWRTDQPQPVRTWKAHDSEIKTLTFAADNQTLITGSSDQTVKGWDTINGAALATLTGHANAVHSVALSADQHWLFTASDDGVVKLWEWPARRLQATLQEAVRPILACALAPDGRTLALGSAAGTVELWDVAAQRKRATLHLPTGEVFVRAVAFSPDSQNLAAGSGSGLVQVWQVNSTTPLLTLPGDGHAIFALAFAPGGQWLAAGGENQTVTLHALTQPNSHRVFKGHWGAVQCLAFSADGQRLLSGGRDRHVKLWELKATQGLTTLATQMKTINALAFAPDNSALATAGESLVKFWEPPYTQIAQTINTQSTTQSNTQSNTQSGAITALAFDSHKQQVAIASSNETVTLWQRANGQAVRISFTGTGEIRALAFSPDGRLVAGGGQASDRPGGEARFVWLWDAATGQELARLSGHTEIIQALAFSPDGGTLASASRGGLVKLWDVAQRRLAATIAVHDHSLPVNALAFAPDGRSFATGSENGAVAFWEVASRRPRLALSGHAQAVLTLAFTPDGKSLATGGRDQTVKFWGVETGQELATFKTHTSEVRALAFSHTRSGDLLATASADGILKLWRTTP